MTDIDVMPAPGLFSYSTDKKDIIFKEYGRNVQNMVAHLLTLEDKEKRTAYAHLIIKMMQQLNPALRDSQEDTLHKLWDQLYIMSEFNLDVDAPFPAPDPEKLYEKPEPMPYSKPYKTTFQYYGHHIDALIRKTVAIEDKEEQQQASNFIARLMKSFYMAWSNETPEDGMILLHLKQMSKGALTAEPEILNNTRNRGGQKNSRNSQGRSGGRNKGRQNNNSSNNRRNQSGGGGGKRRGSNRKRR